MKKLFSRKEVYSELRKGAKLVFPYCFDSGWIEIVKKDFISQTSKITNKDAIICDYDGHKCSVDCIDGYIYWSNNKCFCNPENIKGEC